MVAFGLDISKPGQMDVKFKQRILHFVQQLCNIAMSSPFVVTRGHC